MRLVRFCWIALLTTLGLTACEYVGAADAPLTGKPAGGGVSIRPNADPDATAAEEFRLVPAQQELPTTLLQSGGGQKAIVHSGQWSAPRVAAQLNGTLGNDGAGCVVLQAEGGDDYTLILPEGSEFDGEALVLPAGPPLAVGSRVSVAGARVVANDSLSMCLNYGRLLSVESAAVLP